MILPVSFTLFTLGGAQEHSSLACPAPTLGRSKNLKRWRNTAYGRSSRSTMIYLSIFFEQLILAGVVRVNQRCSEWLLIGLFPHTSARKPSLQRTLRRSFAQKPSRNSDAGLRPQSIRIGS